MWRVWKNAEPFPHQLCTPQSKVQVLNLPVQVSISTDSTQWSWSSQSRLSYLYSEYLEVHQTELDKLTTQLKDMRRNSRLVGTNH